MYICHLYNVRVSKDTLINIHFRLPLSCKGSKSSGTSSWYIISCRIWYYHYFSTIDILVLCIFSMHYHCHLNFTILPAIITIVTLVPSISSLLSSPLLVPLSFFPVSPSSSSYYSLSTSSLSQFS